MLFIALQLFVIGSVIQRGKSSWIPERMLANINNLPGYCKLFGNRLILLCFIAVVCGIWALNIGAYSLKPIIAFGVGMIVVIALFVLDHHKFRKQ